MKTNSSGIKYFPINLQKKTMVYSGSQPQINFNPPLKSSGNSKLEGYSIKPKKEYSIKAGVKDDYLHKSQGNIENNLNKSANLVKKGNSKYNENNKEEFYGNVNSNNKSVSALYKKLNKIPPSQQQGVSQDNYFIVNNIINNVTNDNSNFNNYNYFNNFNNAKKNNVTTTDFNPSNYSKGINNTNNLNNSHYNNLTNSTNNTKNNFYNNKHTSQSTHYNNNITNNNTNTGNNNYINNHSSNVHSVITATRNHNSNLVIPKQVTPIIPSNKASLIMKKMQETNKPSSSNYYKNRDKSADPTSITDNYPFINSKNNYINKENLNVIRPPSKLAKIAEANIKSNDNNNNTNNNLTANTEKDKFEITIKSSSLGKSQGYYNQLNKKVNEIYSNNTNTNTNNTNPTTINNNNNINNNSNKLNQSIKNNGNAGTSNINSNSNKIELITKEATLLSTYNKMSVKQNHSNSNYNNQLNKLNNITDNYTPVNNSLNINPNDNSKIKPYQQELQDSKRHKTTGLTKESSNNLTKENITSRQDKNTNNNNNSKYDKPNIREKINERYGESKSNNTGNLNNTNGTNNNSNSKSTKFNKHESFIKKPSKQQLNNEEEQDLQNPNTNEILKDSPENITSSKIPEHQMGKKSIKHYHQKSLSDNANIDGFTNNVSAYNNSLATTKKTSNNPTFNLELEKLDEEHLYNSIANNNFSQIRNSLFFVSGFLNLEEKIEQNQIEKHVNSLLNEVFKLNSDDIEFFNKHSKIGLNKYWVKLVKSYALLAMLIKFGILEFLLNNILQKKIKTILKIFNTCAIDFLYSTVICRLKYYLSSNSLNGKNGKELTELVEFYHSLSKKLNINKTLHNLNFDYNMKMYDSKIANQLKIFLDELFSENYYISYHAAFSQLISKSNLFSLEKLIFLLNESFYTSLKIKSIENPFDFLAPGKGPSSQLITTFPNKIINKNLTLVLDLDETLVHFAYSPSGGSFIVRPGCFEFLRSVSKCYEVMIFTAATQEYANRVINLVDPQGEFIHHRLYRQHTNMINGEIVKDLSRLNRDLKKIIIVDNIAKNFKLQPNNGFEIKTWTGDVFDTHLFDFDRMLIQLNKNFKDDLRPLVKAIKQQLEKSQFPSYKKVVVPS